MNSDINIGLSEITVYFDVDETLVMWVENENRFVPNEKHILALKRHHLRGHTVVVWSAGGSTWAQGVVEGLGIEEHVDYVLSKPHWYYDDLTVDKFMPEMNRVYYK